MRVGRNVRATAGALLAAVVATACSGGGHNRAAALVGIHKIQHIVVIMQENRSFDSYFGTYPGADGFPMKNGKIAVCVPDRRTHTCITPYPDHHDVNFGGPHGKGAAVLDRANGKMNGFVRALQHATAVCQGGNDPDCALSRSRIRQGGDVMGYHTQSDIPNYWTYAHDFVLQDHMFEPNASWSLPEHLFQVSEWSARCANKNPSSCVNALEQPDYKHAVYGGTHLPTYAWTDLTYLMHRDQVSWGYYVVAGSEPDCANDQALSCLPRHQNAKTPSIWNPLPYFEDVQQDHQLGNIQSVSRFYAAAKNGTLPAVSWVEPSGRVSVHPPSGISVGESYVTSLINAVMRSPDWSSTAIFLAWDDWGGFYDGVLPPRVDENGYGLRVPGMVISPYAKSGYIDHQTLSFDAYAKFIEDDFLEGQPLDPRTDGRPDPRPTVREDVSILGNLANDFDFRQAPRAPILLPVHPATTLIAASGASQSP